ncbi:tRNA methyl transferase [Mycotypha africana]|uniref:tRNA methyl transferase n=1 Tax=Mycotypha africana TaxID=64632 RepID=UPI0023003C2C|nr:tRNA methyl transferase [Mycotypha africana]KAI8991402.1 tRNA methyl transferase [Mycotypha africana]
MLLPTFGQRVMTTRKCTSIFRRCLSILQQQKNKPQKGDRVVVAMSGGVDSSVSAALLKQQGFNVQGIYMRNWDTADERGVCTSQQDWEDVQKVCQKLDIPCQHVDFVKEYWNDVFSKTLDDYAHGLTPNPDIACNSYIKFGALLNKVPKDSWFATGHYCRSTPDGKLLRGLERNKDQSYYLSSVPEEAIARTLFPLGEFTSKALVKQMAVEQFGLEEIAKKKESVGICFVGQRKKFHEFLSDYIDLPPGPAVNGENGHVIGEHNGLYGYTVGQASRICHGSVKWFVADKIVEENKLVCVPGSNHPALFQLGCIARDWVWIHHKPPQQLANGNMEVHAQIRYRQAPEKAILSMAPDGQYRVKFAKPIRGIARGQQVVVWDQDWCLGGGVIDKTFR